MPGGDGTGPFGTFVNCRPYGYYGFARGFGYGFGRGRGNGFGFRRANYFNQQFLPKDQQIAFLEQQQKLLEAEIDEIKRQIEQLRGN